MLPVHDLHAQDDPIRIPYDRLTPDVIIAAVESLGRGFRPPHPGTE